MESNETLLVHLQYLRQGIDGINERLDAQNGRIGLTEKKVAVLEDREGDARLSGTKWGAGVGAGAAAALTALYHYLGNR